MTLILEGLLILAMLGFGKYGRRGDYHLQCFQVDPETRQETSLGYITLHRKQHHIRAKLIQWGPKKQDLESLTYFSIPSESTFLTAAIFDTPEGSSGHNLVLSRNNSLTHRFALSEGVRDPSRLDYCVRIKKSALPNAVQSASRDL